MMRLRRSFRNRSRRVAFAAVAGWLFAALALAILAHPAHAQTSGICGRTAAVQTAILDKLTNRSDCADVTASDLSGITGTLDLALNQLTSVAADDFDGLSSVTKIELGQNFLPPFPRISSTASRPSRISRCLITG